MAQLQDLFQTHAVVKILDHLTLYKEFEYNRTEIADETGISRRTLYQVWPFLEKFDLVKVTKSAGRIKFFKLNTENPISKQLVALADEISFFMADKIAGVKSIAIVPTSLQTYVSSPERQKHVRASGIIISKLNVEGPASEVGDIFRKILDPTKNGGFTISIPTSTESETATIKKKKDQPIPQMSVTE